MRAPEIDHARGFAFTFVGLAATFKAKAPVCLGAATRWSRSQTGTPSRRRYGEAIDAGYVALADALGAVLFTRDTRLAAVTGHRARELFPDAARKFGDWHAVTEMLQLAWRHRNHPAPAEAA